MFRAFIIMSKLINICLRRVYFIRLNIDNYKVVISVVGVKGEHYPSTEYKFNPSLELTQKQISARAIDNLPVDFRSDLDSYSEEDLKL